MLPLTLDIATWPVLLVGIGQALERRVSLVRAAGALNMRVHDMSTHRRLPTGAQIADTRLFLVAGLPYDDAKSMADIARSRCILVNVEDVPELCDFHVPALVRRGDLSIAISTAGRVPGLAAALRRRLEHQFGDEWASHVAEAGLLRARMRSDGMAPADIARAMENCADVWLRPGPPT